MARVRKFFLVCFPALLITTLASSCVHTRSSQYSEAPRGEVFLSPTPTFEADSLSKWLGPVSEFDKINYLLNRIARTEHRFIRNGDIHDGKKARLWLLYKMTHWVNGVGTAADFVTKVAAYSQKTGQPYLVEFPEGRLYSLSSVLMNELFAFETQLARFKELHPGTLAKPDQLSISPTAVASTAVATSTT